MMDLTAFVINGTPTSTFSVPHESWRRTREFDAHENGARALAAENCEHEAFPTCRRGKEPIKNVSQRFTRRKRPKYLA
jgi:hypothetical protein